MSDTPTYIEAGTVTEVPRPYETLTAIQRAYVDWKALDGIITDDNGVHELTLTKLGEMLRPNDPVSAQVISHSCKNIPNFWDLVTARRKEFNNTSRLAFVHRKWYLKAATVDNWPVTEAWLINNDPDYVQKNAKKEESSVNSLLDALELARNTHREVIEAEITTTPNNANPNVLPEASS